MTRRAVGAVLVVWLLAVAAATPGGSGAAPIGSGGGPGGSGVSPASDRRAAELEDRLGPGVTASVHEETGAIRFVGTAPGRPIARPAGVDAGAPPAAAARAFLARYGAYFGLRDQARELRAAAVRAGPRGGSSIRFGQVHEGVPVLAGELVVNLDRDRNVLSVGGELLPTDDLANPPLNLQPTVGASEAAEAALAAVAKARGAGAADLRAAPPRLEIFDSRLLGGPGLGRPALVWRTEVRSGGGVPIRELVLVDAHLGRVALRFDQIAHAKHREVCDANNSVSQYPCTSPVRSEGDPPHAVADVNQAYDFAGDTYDFYFDRFGRDSLDGAGMDLISTVRWCDPGSPPLVPAECPYANAFWDGEQMVYGEGFATDDVVGHELTHGVTEFSSKLFYYYQSGAINESLSDVFGEFVDLTNGAGTDTPAVRWLLGEDLPSSIGVIRDMKDPTAFGDPDRMTSPNYEADPAEEDAGGVHFNSGVNNKAAYLMTDGDTFNGRTVTGLGIDKVARIYYEAQTALLTSASDYADLYDALNQACANLVGTGGITAADCVEVDDAVLATEMNVDPPAAPAPHAPVCPTGATPVSSFFDDLENTASGNWAITTIEGTNAWYYPQNPNPYNEEFGWDPTYATSGTTNFWGDDAETLGDSAIAMTSNVTVPAGGYLHFQHAFGFEDGFQNRPWDGGVLEYSLNGGPWRDVTDPTPPGPLPFTHNGYNGTIYDKGNANNPLMGRGAFVRESNGYISTRLDLSSIAGQQVRFRFRIGTDSAGGDYGWFIDDVRLYRCDGGADTDPPETTILSGPSGPTNDATPTFTFSSSESNSTFECRFDGAPFGPCSGPGDSHTPAAPLSEGPHTFEVRATDPSNNTDLTPASRSFTVDTQAPAAPAITATDPDSPSAESQPLVKGTSSGDTVTVEVFTQASCAGSPTSGTKAAFDGAGIQVSVGLNQTTQLSAQARDAAGNASACSPSFPYAHDDIAPAAPAITATDPNSPANDNQPEVKGSAEAGSTVRLYESGACSGPIEAQGGAASFSSPGLTASVADDLATQFTATATDAAGNTSACSGSFAYTEDSTAPETQIDSGPSGSTTDATPTFTFSSSESNSTFECRFDGAPFGPCSGPGDSHTPASDLSLGGHTFEVRATDQAANTEQTPASQSFTVESGPPDTDPPETTILSGPSGPTNDATPTFTFSSSESNSTFECRFDGAPFGPCSGPGDSHTPAAPLSDGPHTFEVRATDPSNNTDLTPASRAFTVQTGGAALPPPFPLAPRPRCAGVPATIVGSPGKDIVTGTKRRDVIVTFGGNDVVRGRGGKDLVCGGKGRDRLVGQGGRDRLLGQAGPDRLLGGRGRDALLGGRGRDVLWGQGGRGDLCSGGAGRDARRARGCERIRGIP